MLADASQALLSTIAGLPPLVGFMAVILATFILEDVAIVGTALLAGTGMMSPTAGLIALLIGIVLGDLGLYGLGYGGARLPGLRRYVDTRAAQKIRSIGAENTFSLVFSTRFVPGMRLPTYTSLGYVGASFWRFCQAVLIAVTVWTVALYLIIFFFGQHVLSQIGPWKYVAIAALLVFVIAMERLLITRARRKTSQMDQGQSNVSPQ